MDKNNQSKFDSHLIISKVPTICKHEKIGQIRILKEGGEFWFVAKDIVNILGYSDTNAMTKHLEAHEYISVKLMGMNMPHTLINEAGLDWVIFKSRVEGADRFNHWVTREILPSIRKHDFYGTDDFIDKILANPNGIVTFLGKYKNERQQRRLAEQQRDEAIVALKSQNIITYNLTWQLMNTEYVKNKKIEYLNGN